MVMPLPIAYSITSAISHAAISIVTGIISGCTFVPASPAAVVTFSVSTVATPSAWSPNIIICINTVVPIITATTPTAILTPASSTASDGRSSHSEGG